ncbi:hypothetical protein [Flavobacterium aquatile]|uniref:Uncharacterized protein n=1 Tax=Flavobacterium aquatile LMG 4008 = ATCC 11947 TaxID=1453498 RepID=A0A095UZ08_9FLAO|nr:hypothetical protein [Flavobacterium aquatile]KGD67815.1 hypothetical protein LG45_11905 [Flavobacterium aquatile LMG 4008 = ATCC 11947]OXA67676.1 hypothetical protein B0A61_07640 [Flavobacterium aquatile LMG 4008 = ATCC 11947]GEC78313.1 hypothetical protein FAQ01_11830 [Flavobacterium aquatile]
MEVYKRIIEIIDANLIYCFPPLILILLLIRLLFKNKFKTKEALNIVRWLIIAYAAITTSFFIIGMVFIPEEFAFTNRATGSYWFASWLMLIAAVVMPFTLLFKKLASKFLYVLLISILLKIGSYFERFVILVTSLHRDYTPQAANSYLPDFAIYITMVFVQGLVLAILLLGIVEISYQMKLRSQRSKV